MTIIIDGSNGTTGNLANGDLQVNGVNVGKGGGALTYNTAVGYQALNANTTGQNTTVGYQALLTNTTGTGNYAFGWEALRSNTTGGGNSAFGGYHPGFLLPALYSNTTGTQNIAMGSGALAANTTGSSNTGIGWGSLNANTTASNNTAVGYQAGYAQTTAAEDVWVGYQAGYGPSGGSNTGVGFKTLKSTNGSYSTAIGWSALTANTSGTANTGLGYGTLYVNTTGGYNVAVGASALQNNTTASNNTAVGYQSLYSKTTGDSNTGIGYQAGYSVTTAIENTFVGQVAGYSTTGANNTFVGRAAGYQVTTGAKNTIVGGYQGNSGGLDIRTASNYIVLSDGDGNPRGYYSTANAGWVFPQSSATATPINTSGVAGDTLYQAVLITKFDNNSTTSQNFIQFQVNNGGANSGRITANGANAATFTSTSDSRLKENIVDLPSQLNNICALRPVEFDYIESEGGGHQIGFIAQEMQAVYPDVVNEQEDGMLAISGWSKTEARLVKAIQELKAEFDAYKASHP